MDKQELQQNIAHYYSKLPPKLQNFFSSMEWIKTLDQLSEKYALSENQKQTLGTETTLLLIGLVNVEDYESILDQELKLPEDLINKIIEDINTSIVDPNREEIIQSFANNTESRTIEDTKREEELDARFATLPQKVQDAIREVNYHATLYAIAEEQKLTVPQIIDLESIVTDTMLGTISTEKFESSIKNNLKLPAETAEKIILDVKERILQKIRASMMERYSAAGTDAPLGNETLKKAEAVTVPPTGNDGTIVENREDILKKIEDPEPVQQHPILAQKLSGPMQVRPVQTVHSLDNLTKSSAEKMPEPEKAQTNKTYGVDPYREIPE